MLRKSTCTNINFFVFIVNSIISYIIFCSFTWSKWYEHMDLAKYNFII